MRNFLRGRHSNCLALALVLPSASCRKVDQPRENVTVFLAASLDDVIGELALSFESKTGVTIARNAGASGALRKQIELGSPADLFISADPLQVDALFEAGRAVRASKWVLAQNRLVIALPKGAEPDLNLPSSLLGSRYKRVAVAVPESAPAGRYAKQAIGPDLWAKLQSKWIYADDVRLAAQYAELGTVDAAIVYQTEVHASSKLFSAYTFPAESHDPCLYVAAIVANRPDTRANEFLQFIASQPAQSTWRKHGFDPPPTITEPRP